MEIGAQVARALLQIKAIQLSPQKPFTWASGIKSPIYCDNRLVLSHIDYRRLVIKGFQETIKQSFGDFDAVAGVATAGIAHGILLAEAENKPFAYVRAKAKGHGRQNLIEGHLEPGQRVMVVEDLISTGMSSLAAVTALREYGVEVVGCVAIFTYGFERAVAAFAEANCPLATITNYNELIQIALENGSISADSIQYLNDWRSSVGAVST